MRNVQRITALLPFVILIALYCSSCEEKESAQSPNVIYIFADQFRQYSLGFWSQAENRKYIQGNPDPVITPTLDKLAEGGVVFSRSVSNYPLCSPHRGMLLTGMYPDQNGLTNNCRRDRETQLRRDAACVTDVFSKAGYQTAYFGKCHWQKTEPLFDEEGNYVGSTDAPGGHYVNRYDTYVPPGPDRHRIDYFFQLLKDEHFNPRCYSSDPKNVNGLKDGELYLPKRFSSELEAESIMNYLSNTHDQRDPSKPFFLIWSMNPPHNPWTKESTYMPFFDQYTDAAGEVHLDQLLTRENADSSVGHYAPYYFANVSAVDFFIGQVMQRLEELDLEDNTIIAFSSDHGEMLGSQARTGKNGPEIEAFSIPFLLKWGENIQHRVEDLILSVPDVMPTLLGLAGLKEQIPAEVQGVDYSGLLLDEENQSVQKPTGALFLQTAARGIYTGKYMFVVHEKEGKFESAFCYDNEKDPYQLNRIPFEEMEVTTRERLKKELYALLKQTNDRWYQEGVCAVFLSANRKS